MHLSQSGAPLSPARWPAAHTIILAYHGDRGSLVVSCLVNGARRSREQNQTETIA
jgi:hypothetical protein